MMLNINTITDSDAAKDYYNSEWSKSDDLDKYYKNDEVVFGKDQWGGKAAAMLGLEGDVEKQDFYALCDNINPQTGDPITPKTKANRRIGNDFTFQACKSVSVLALVMKDDQLVKAFHESVHETMQEIEKAAEVRVRKDGANHDRVSDNMVWSEHIHTTARPVDGISDCHLHCHVVAFNSSYDEQEKRFKALNIGSIKRDAVYYEAAFNTRLANKVKALGYKIERNAKGWEIAGVDRETIELFSRRMLLIEEKSKELGLTGKAKADLGRKTREAKTNDKSLNELQQEWLKRLTPEQRTRLENVKETALDKEQVSAKESLDYAKEHVFERRSVISEKRLFAEALKKGVGDVLPEDLQKLEDKDLLKADRGGQRLCTTKEALNTELDMLRMIKNGLGTCSPISREDFSPNRDFLNEGQLKAIEHVLKSQDDIMAIVGKAGSGKSTLLEELKENLDKKGVAIHGFAPTANASRTNLREKGFETADTLQRLLTDPQLQRRIAKEQGILMVDEAGLISGKMMHDLMKLSLKMGTRLLLVGDPKQHNSPSAGDAYRIMLDSGALKSAKVNEVMRQKDPKLKEAVVALSEGQISKGMNQLDKLGAIIETENDKIYEQMAEQYSALNKGNGSVVMIAPTHAEGRKLTEAVRDQAKKDGHIEGDEHIKRILDNMNLTKAQRADIDSYQSGQVVCFDRCAPGFKRGVQYEVKGKIGNKVYLQDPSDMSVRFLPREHAERFNVYEKRKLAIAKGDVIRLTKGGRFEQGSRFNNGTYYKVTEVDQDGSLQLDNGKTLPKEFAHFTNGYVTTSHSSQGLTAKYCLALMNSHTLPAVNMQQTYVSISRSQAAVRIFTDDKAEMINQALKSGERLGATELIPDVSTKTIDLQTRWRNYQEHKLRIGNNKAGKRSKKLTIPKTALNYKRQNLRGNEQHRTR